MEKFIGKSHDQILEACLTYSNRLVVRGVLEQDAIKSIAKNFSGYLSTKVPIEYLADSYKLASEDIRGDHPNAMHIEAMYKKNFKEKYLAEKKEKDRREKEEKKELEWKQSGAVEPEKVSELISGLIKEIKFIS